MSQLIFVSQKSNRNSWAPRRKFYVKIIIKRMYGVWYCGHRAYSTREDALQAAWSGRVQA